MQKIEIDIHELLGDPEFLRESIEEKVKETILQGIGKNITAQVSNLINQELARAIEKKMPELVNAVLDDPYVKVDQWGDREGSKPTTFRTELVRAVNDQMTYKKKTFSSDENAFTKAVDGVVAANVRTFKESFNKLVNDTFTKDALNYAVAKLRERLKV